MKRKKNRRTFTVEQKAAILRRHLVDKVAVADLCEEYKLQPSVFYGWQQQAMLNLEASVSYGGTHEIHGLVVGKELTRESAF